MSTTNTPRLNLSEPDGVEGMPLLDRDWNTPMDIIDAAAGQRIVTSGTLPVSPYVGQICKESDTGKTIIWNGSAWIVYTITDTSWYWGQTNAVTVPTSTLTVIPWNSKVITANCNVHASGVQLPVPGIYYFICQINWDSRAINNMNFTRGNFVDLRDTTDTTTISSFNEITNQNTANAANVSLMTASSGIVYSAVPNQIIKVQAYQTSGGAFNVTSSLNNRFAGVLLQPIDNY